MAKLRVGVALLLPPPIGQEVDGLRRALADPSLGRVPAHLTLVPPVNVRSDALSRALAVLRRAAAAAPPMLGLTIGPPASFLPTNPVIYLAVGGDLPGLHRLRDAVFVPPLARPLTWPFEPHVTLADGAEPSVIEQAIAVLGSYQAAVPIDRVYLLQELRGDDGRRRWEPLADATFGRPAVVATGSPLALELTRSRLVDPEAAALLEAEGVPDPTSPSGLDFVVTARQEGAVVGVGWACFTPDGVQTGVVVASAHRGQGIGRHLSAATRSGSTSIE